MWEQGGAAADYDGLNAFDYDFDSITSGMAGETKEDRRQHPYPQTPWYTGAHCDRYRIIVNPGNHVGLEANLGCSPDISFVPTYFYPPYSYPEAYYRPWNVTAGYVIQVYPLTINLGGGTSKTRGHYLIGQRMTADLSSVGYLQFTASGDKAAYQWSLTDGGDPFEQFLLATGHVNSSGRRIDLSAADLTQSSLACSFARPGTPTISCTGHLSVPAGSLPTAGLDAVISANLDVSIPTPSTIPTSGIDTTRRTLDVVPGVVSLYPGSRTTPGYVGVTDADDDGNKMNPTGIRFRAGLTTPPEFVSGADKGGWLWMQLIEEASFRQCGSFLQRLQLEPDATGDVLNSIDAGFPYAPVTQYDSMNATIVEVDAGQPSGFKMYAADGKITQTHDTPGQSLNFTDDDSPLNGNGLPIPANYYSVGDNFSVWQMYRPPGSGSQFVPIQAFTWWYDSGGGVGWSGTNWAYSTAYLGHHDVVIGPGVRSPDPFEWPKWTRIEQRSFPRYRANPNP